MRLIDRAVQVLNALADSPMGLALTELSAQLDLPVGSTHRVLASLMPSRFVYQGDDRRYRIGPGIVRLAQAFQHQGVLLEVSKPLMDDTSRELRESVFLSELIGEDVVCVATAEAPRLLTFYMRISERTPYHAGASARAILAYCADEVITSRLAAENMVAFTNRTPTTMAVAMAKLDAARRDGFAVCDEEMEIGVTAIGVPIFDADRHPVAALTVVAPSDRLHSDLRGRIVAKLQAAAREISAGLGCEAWPLLDAPEVHIAPRSALRALDRPTLTITDTHRTSEANTIENEE